MVDHTPFDANELEHWWLEMAKKEVEPLIDKLVEYGGGGRAVDLCDIGHDLARIQKRTVTDAEAAEIGIFFYVRGKMGRWLAALNDSRMVSDDTLYDIGIYVRMVQRIREKGGWPI